MGESRRASVGADEVRRAFPDLARGVAKDDLLALARALEIERRPANEPLVQQGQHQDRLWLVVEGSVEAVLEGGPRPLVLGVSRRGDAVGELGFLDPGVASATVRTLERCVFWTLDPRGADAVRAFAPRAMGALERWLMRVAARRLRQSADAVGAALDDGGRVRLAARASARRGLSSRLAGLLASPAPRGVRTSAAVLLRDVPGLSDLPAPYRDALERACERRSFRPGEVLIRRGARDLSLVVVLRGSVEVQARTGSLAVTKVLGPGALVGWVALLDPGPRSATCTARTAVDAAVLPGPLAMQLMGSEGPVWQALQRAVILQAVRDARSLNARLREAIERGPGSPPAPG
jgi:CRP-like cAMP-binding protein